MSDETTLYKAQTGKLMEIKNIPLPAVLLIGGGVALLAANLLHIDLMNYLWPGFVIGAGALLIWPAYNSTAGRQSAWSFLAIPGAMIVMQGVLLFLMNLVNHFESMAYSWTLVLAAGAYGWMYIKRFDPTSNAQEKGHRFIRAMVILFMGLATAFEVLAFQSLGGWWPLLLIGFGIYLFVKNQRK
jgi:hypothetical protein